MITQFKIKVIEQNNGILFLFAPSDISKKLANCSICQFSSLSRYLANDHSIQNQGDRRNIMVHLKVS